MLLTEWLQQRHQGKPSSKLIPDHGHCNPDPSVWLQGQFQIDRHEYLIDLKTLISDLTGKGINIHFHKEGLIFKGNEKANEMNMMMLRIMGAVAEFERANLKERQMEGIVKAKERGAYKGRKRTLDLQPILDAYKTGMKKSEVMGIWYLQELSLQDPR